MLFCPPRITPVRARDALSSHPGTVPSIDEGGNVRYGRSQLSYFLLYHSISWLHHFAVFISFVCPWRFKYRRRLS